MRYIYIGSERYTSLKFMSGSIEGEKRREKVDGIRLENIKTKYISEALDKYSSLMIPSPIVLSVGIRHSQTVSYYRLFQHVSIVK